MKLKVHNQIKSQFSTSWWHLFAQKQTQTGRGVKGYVGYRKASQRIIFKKLLLKMKNKRGVPNLKIFTTSWVDPPTYNFWEKTFQHFQLVCINAPKDFVIDGTDWFHSVFIQMQTWWNWIEMSPDYTDTHGLNIRGDGVQEAFDFPEVGSYSLCF